MITLRDYQQDVVESIYKTQKRGITRQLVVMSTGLGKSFTLTQVILDHVKRGKRTLVLVDQEDLVWQWKNYIHSMDANIRVGIEKAEYKSKLTDQVVIATVQTLGRKGVKRIKRFKPDHFSYCVADEAHKTISKTWFRVLNYFGFGKENFTEGNLLTGCTATPFRNSGESLGILFDDIVANYDLRFAMSEGWLTDISLYDVKTSTDLSKYKNQGEFDQAVNNEARNLEALKAYKQISNGEQALIYTASVDHAYELVELFNKNGIPSEVIEANTDKTERKEFLKDYKTKDVRCLMNFGTLTTGTDLPETSTLMLLRPVQSKLLLTQILGRGLRPSASAMVDRWQTKEDRLNAIMLSKKPFCKIIDLHDKVGKHNFAHIPSLFGLHNKLKTKQPKQFFKEVVEPLDNAKKEHGVDISQITDPDDIKLIVKNRKVEIKSLRTPQHIQEFTDRSWVQIDNGFEILYDDNALIIEKDNAKSELVDKEEWNLFVYNTKDQLTKKLQTFNSLSGAFKIADEYADAQKWNKRFVKKEPWNDLGVTEGQLNMLTKFFVYNNGYSKFRTLEERYPDTNLRKVYWKPTGEVLDRGMASKIISDFFNNK
jgi:ATP-dependent helicase IRC3